MLTSQTLLTSRSRPLPDSLPRDLLHRPHESSGSSRPYPLQLTSDRLLLQIAGAIPITSRFEGSAIPETAGLFDLGQHPVGAVNGTGSITLDWRKRWTQTVCEAAGASGEARMRSVLEVWRILVSVLAECTG